MKKVAVLSKYKEKNNFWHDLLLKNYEVIVYNKSEGENLLPNVGREGHTFIHHIVENYENLPDEILFSQYDPTDHFSGNKKIHFSHAMENFLNKTLIDYCGIRPTDFDLMVRRRKIDWVDFSKELFGKFDNNEIYKLIACGSTLNGVFRVSKNAILQNSLSLYKKCLEMLSRGSDPFEGYYFERMWKFLFMHTGCENKDFEDFNDRVFLFGTTDTQSQVPMNVRYKMYKYGHIKLSNDGTIRSNGNISYYHHFNESYWLIRDSYLYFLDGCGAATSQYEISKNVSSFFGKMTINSQEVKERAFTLSNPFWK